MLEKLQLRMQNKILIFSFAVFILLYLIINSKMKENKIRVENKPVYADTLIPQGHVLVPLEIANIQAVAGLIDQYGIIDLYAGSENNSILLAARVKILKAPLNPNQYAVMVEEALSKDIMKHKGPFWAVIQNRFNQTEQSLAQSDPKNQNRQRKKVNTPIEVEYYSGEN